LRLAWFWMWGNAGAREANRQLRHLGLEREVVAADDIPMLGNGPIDVLANTARAPERMWWPGELLVQIPAGGIC
jgi:hypothetical protein